MSGADTGFSIDPASIGKLAGQLGGALGSLSGKAGGTGGKVLGAVGGGLAGAGTGAGIGAAIGSVIPGLGTVIGGAVGAIGGAIAGVVRQLTGSRKLRPDERRMLERGLRASKRYRRAGPFQDAMLYIYRPASYRRLRARKQLPSHMEARLLKKLAYAKRAREVERKDGSRLRREVADLPPDFQTMVGVGAVTGHSRALSSALRQALAEREGQEPAPEIEPAVELDLEDPFQEMQAMDMTDPQQESEENEPNEEAGAAQAPPFIIRSVLDVLDAGDALYSWRPIHVSYKPSPSATTAQTFYGVFWVFADALKDRSTGLRVPCTAAETQAFADKLRVSSRSLPGWQAPIEDEALQCLMMTTRLMCARWLHAKQAGEVISPHPDATHDLLIAGVMRMHKAIEADLAQLNNPSPWVADPGKIWALHRRLFDGSSKGGVNYGWHVDPSSPFARSPNAAIPGVSLIQSAGGAHNEHYTDYSQILLLVAPWCLVAGPGKPHLVPMRTADVYRSPELAGLVTDDAQPLPSVRQPFDPKLMRAARDALLAEQRRMYEGKLRRGLSLLDLPRNDDTGSPLGAEPPSPSPHDPFLALQRRRISYGT